MGLMERLGNASAALFASPGIAAQLAAQVEPSAARFGPSVSGGDSAGWLVHQMGGMPSDAGVAVNEATAITLTTVYACVTLIADAIAQLPLNVYESLPSGGRRPVPGHPLQSLLHDSPTDEMSSFIWRQTSQHHALMWGNGYTEIERTRGGDAVGLLLLYPNATEPVKRAGQPLYYRTNINGRSFEIPAADVLHIPALGFDGFKGYSPVHIARNAIGMGLAMEKFGGKFFANDSRSGGFLMHPGKLGDAALNNVQSSFQKQGGNDNAFKVKVLEEGMKFVSTSIPPDDAQFLGSREFQVAELARMYRVPLVLLQAMEKATSWGSGIEQQMIGFVVWTIQPWIVRWESEMNRKLLTKAERARGLFIKFNLNALMRGDMKARAEFYKALHGVSAINPNEIRAFEEFNPYEGGDRFYYPTNMGDAQDMPEPEPAPDPDLDPPPEPDSTFDEDRP